MGFAKYLEDIIERFYEELPERPAPTVRSMSQLQDVHRALYKYYELCSEIREELLNCLKQARTPSFELAKRAETAEQQLRTTTANNSKLKEKLQVVTLQFKEEKSEYKKLSVQYKKLVAKLDKKVYDYRLLHLVHLESTDRISKLRNKLKKTSRYQKSSKKKKKGQKQKS